ncbi:MAG: type II toxin-antitoxin system RelE/ParE family toxin [bacterium]
MKNKCEILYLSIAQKDLTEIIEYIMADNPQAARNFLDRFDKAILQLRDFPLKGKLPKDNRLQRHGYRIMVVGNYLVFYVVQGKTVQIRRILHGKRKYAFLL